VIWLLLACDRDYDGPDPEGDGAAVFGRVGSLLGAGLGDVTVCVHEHDELPCAVTEGDGEFLLEGLPVDTDVIVTMEREDNLPTAFLHNTALTEAWDKTLMPSSLVDSMANRVDTTLDPELGHTLFIVWSEASYQSDRVEGVSFAIAPDAGISYYQGSGAFPDPDATATTSSGAGGAFNVQPGDYAITLDDPRGDCTGWFTWDHEPGDAVPVRVIAGFSSYMDLVCP
jgi:hypothetical protein